MSPSDSREYAARLAFAYLAENDPPPAAPVDAILGFGTFDLQLARFCGELFRRDLARHVIFTGGIGAGTGDLGQPEADAWAATLLSAFPDFPRDRLILESRSTNTAENIVFTTELLARARPALAFGTGLRSALLVASPSRLRRVRLTMWRHHPSVTVTRRVPPHTFEHERALYTAQGFDYFDHLAGELDRIVAYADRGWIAPEPLPPAIAAARRQLGAV